MNLSVPFYIALILLILQASADDTESNRTKDVLDTAVLNMHPFTFTPAKNMSEETGTLKIDVFPKECTVVLNEHTLGKGDQLIHSLPAGDYNLFVRSSDKYTSKEITVRPQRTTTVHVRLARKTTFLFEPKYSAVLMGEYYAYGPQIGAGVKLKNNLLMLDFNYDVEVNIESYKETTLIGGALKWSYCFDLFRHVTIAPGLSAGYWRSNATVWGINSEIHDQYEGTHYGGPHVKLMVFKGALKLITEYSLLLGTDMVHVAGIGANITF